MDTPVALGVAAHDVQQVEDGPVAEGDVRP
jgi:hypothetical protein